MPPRKRNLKQNHEDISLRLTDYDDIFSVFDPRPFSERALSVDFLDEARRASMDKPSGSLELNLLVPAHLRNSKKEDVIKRRLTAHFAKHSATLRSKHDRCVRGGIVFAACGIFIMFLASLVLSHNPTDGFFMDFLLILFEPAGWFFFWEGLDQVIFESKKTLPELEFHEKLANSEINFLSG